MRRAQDSYWHGPDRTPRRRVRPTAPVAARASHKHIETSLRDVDLDQAVSHEVGWFSFSLASFGTRVGDHLGPIARRWLAKIDDVMRPRYLGGIGKRMLDLVLASIALVLAAPIMLLVAASIRLTMGGPVLFSQDRVGFNGRTFKCLKFRTMVTNADEVLREHLANCPDADHEWQTTCKLARDPRIEPLGQILRKSSLDELPQIFNILRGDMSCVGPRPVVPPEIEKYGAHKGEYLRALPGLTGLWQCKGRSQLSYDDRVALDVRYVRNWSLGMDLQIILLTIPALLRFEQSA